MTRYQVEKPNGTFEDIGASRASFGPAHVVFTDDAGQLVVALRAQDVISVIKEDE